MLHLFGGDIMEKSGALKEIQEIYRELPEDLQNELLKFARQLKSRRLHRKKIVPKGWTASWAGALSELKEKYTSVELQHEILKMRVNRNRFCFRA